MTDVTDGAWPRMVSAVRTRLAELGWSQGELARRSKLNVDTVSDFLAGRRRAKPESLAAMEAAVGWEKGALAEIAAGAPLPLSTALPMLDLNTLVEDIVRAVRQLPRESQLAILSEALTRVIQGGGRR